MGLGGGEFDVSVYYEGGYIWCYMGLLVGIFGIKVNVKFEVIRR